jgi:hypothetical protein
MRLLSLTGLAFAWLAYGQEQLDSTGQMSNGRAWNAFASDMKIFYVSGLHDAMVMTVRREGPLKLKELNLWTEGFNVGDYVKELDTLYRGGENVRIPIPMALAYCSKKLEGTSTKEELEQTLIAVRKLVSALK